MLFLVNTQLFSSKYNILLHKNFLHLLIAPKFMHSILIYNNMVKKLSHCMRIRGFTHSLHGPNSSSSKDNIAGTILIRKLNNLEFIHKDFHFSRKCERPHSDTDIPVWLQEFANEVPEELRDNLYNDELEEIAGFVMENEIVDFFLSRAISYEELDSSFMVKCPSCEDDNVFHNLFIDKKSGFCVCPGCFWEGCWEDFIVLLNAKESCISAEHLKNIINSSALVQESHESLLISFPFNLGIEKLQEIDTRISSDHTIAYIPVKSENDTVVGVASISLLHPSPQVFLKLLERTQGLFTTFPLLKKTTKKVLLTSNIMNALKLAKLKILSVVLVGDHNDSSFNWAFQNFKNIILWYEGCVVPSNMLSYFMSKNMNIFLVKANIDQKMSLLSNKKITTLIAEAIPLLKDSIITFSDVESEVYGRLINKDKIYGTKWIRFKELNEFLLGHRQGELTVISGPTGCGKTTFMSEYSLDLCMQGVHTLWGSFEISVPRLCEVMMQQYSGSYLSENYSEFKILASKFAELPLYFFNTHGQQPIQDVVDVMINAVLLKGVQHIVIDNLQFMLGLNGASADWWLDQDRAVGAFRNFATSFNCHITLIVHPRKLTFGEKLNMNTISGGARVTQEADNVLLLQVSENKDGSRNPLGPKILQIVKNRYGGTLGEMKLRFHKESLTLSSCFNTKSKDGTTVKSVKEGLENLAAAKGLPPFNWDTW